MINGFDINPLTHDLHLSELERMATGSGRANRARYPTATSRSRTASVPWAFDWCRRLLAWRGVRAAKAAAE